MKRLKHRFSLWLREQVMRHYGIPFSRHSVESMLINHLPPHPLNFIDVGASAGEFADALKLQSGLRRAILIEPQPRRCEELRRRFPDKTVEVHQCALSDQEGSTEMEILNWDYSSSLLPVKRDIPTVSSRMDLGVREKIQCRVTTLDTLLEQTAWNTGEIDLLKIDVQGAEMLALHGAIRTLPRVQLLLTEVSFRHLYEGSGVFSEVYDFLTCQGFQLLSIGEAFRGADGELLQGDTLFRKANFNHK